MKFNLRVEFNTDPEELILDRQNHEGTKSLILEWKCFENITDLKFTLLDFKYNELAS